MRERTFYITMANLIGLAFFIIMAGCTQATSGPKAEKAADPVEWSTDWPAVTAQAREADKPILLLFTGSDWCTYCIRLEENVFDTVAFKDFAEDDVLLYKADFPRRKELPAKVERQNNALQETYPFRGFPTVFVLSPEGEVLGQMGGYGGSSPADYIAELKNYLPAKA